jgi:hypothetical protein
MTQTLTKINRSNAKTLRAETEQALQAVADKYGLSVNIGNGRFNDDQYRAKFEFNVAAQTTAPGSPAVSKKDVAAAKKLGLPEDIIGRQFKSGRTTYTVSGFNLRRRKYPVSGIGPKGGRYKFPADAVQRGLIGGGATPAKPKRPEAEVMADILGVYSGLSPENLSCDGEASASHIRRRRADLNAKLRELETEVGRKVSESEAYDYTYSKRQSA